MVTLGALEYLISVNSSGVKSGIDKAEREVKSSGDRVGKQLDNFGNKISAWTVAKGQMIASFAETAMRKTATLMKTTIKSAVEAYADFEQLEGGVKKLFGSDYQRVMNNASKAFKTAGISANEYMQTVTEFSAALISGLSGDTKKAAEIADQALIDMADNANTFGSSMESIQNAYRGFSKQNYTMLDNLKLGYGGTRSEMERLLKDAQKLSGVKYDIKNLSDVYEAIHVIQQNMGIAGTTQKEAEGTISGALNSAKAAWKDLLVALGSGKGVKEATKNFGDRLAKTVKNIRPVAMNVLKGIFESVKTIFPELKSLFHETMGAIKLQLADWLDLGDDASWLDIGKKMLGKLKGGMKTSITSLLGLTDSNGNALGTNSSWTQIAEGFIDKLTTGLGDGGWLSTAIETAFNNASSLVTSIAGFVSELLDDGTFIESLGTLATTFADAIGKVLLNENLWSALYDTLFAVFFGGKKKEGQKNKISEQLGLTVAGSATGTTVEGKDGKVYTKDAKGNFVSADGSTLKKYNKAEGTLLGFGASVGIGGRLGGPIGAGAGVLLYPMIAKVLDQINYEGSDQQALFDNFTKSIRKGIYGKDVSEGELLTKNTAKSLKVTLTPDLFKSDSDVIMSRQSRAVMKHLFTGEAITEENGMTFLEKIDESIKNGIKLDVKPVVSGDAEKVIADQIPDIPVTVYPSFSGSGSGTAYTFDPVGGIFNKLFGHAKGDWNVPYDNYPSLLHRGEMVLTASQARRYRDGEMNADYGVIGEMIGSAINQSMKKVYVMMSGEKVGDLTTKRVKRNINASSYSKTRAMGG